MDFYVKEVSRFRSNFQFSLKIYDDQELLQRTLCVQMRQKLTQLFIPKEYLAAHLMRKQLLQDIQIIYLQLVETHRPYRVSCVQKGANHGRNHKPCPQT